MKQVAGLILTLIHLNLYAQEFYRLVDEIPVTRFEQPLDYPFLGGLDAFDPRFADIDADTDLDLFILQPDGRIFFLENTAEPPDHHFHLVTDHFADINAHGWFFPADMDGDGDLDMYTDNGNLGLAFYRNQGSVTSPDFVLESQEILATNGLPVFGEPSSFPAFADIDADGDLDFFSGLSSGTIAWYENVGSADWPAFLLATTEWQDLLIVSGLNRGAPQLLNRHGANAVEFCDLDGDGDQDFFYGDLFHPGVYFLQNDGTPEVANVAITDSLFPKPQHVSTMGFNLPRFADIDRDGDPDFFAASQNQQRDNFQHYSNTGTTDNPRLKIASKNFLPMVDVGSHSAPALVDIDADDGPDLFVGNLDGNLAYFQNTGSAAPAFSWITDAFENVNLQGPLALPAFADIDADGDQDLFVGSFFGTLAFLENVGSATSPDFSLVATEFQGIDVGNGSAPSLADLDADGDLDLAVGESDNAVINIFENVGNASQPQFELRREIAPPGDHADAVPHFYDWDGDGHIDLLVGEQAGRVMRFEGTGKVDSFVLADEFLGGMDVGFSAAPALADLTGDGTRHFVVGNQAGGISIFRAGPSSRVTSREAVHPAAFELRAYPNPVRDRLTVTVRWDQAGISHPPDVAVYNILGQEVAELKMRRVRAGEWVGVWRANESRNPAGLYFLRSKLGKGMVSGKVLLLR